MILALCDKVDGGATRVDVCTIPISRKSFHDRYDSHIRPELER
jgi:hypothetical protein